MLTVRFVKRFLFLFIGWLVLFFSFPDYSEIIWGVLLIGGILIAMILQGGFPTTQITVDEDRISFNREFPSWHLLKKYHLHELVIPHNDWDSWIKVVYRSGEENNVSYYYLFFKDERLRFVAETAQNNNMEYWVQKKFPDRQLETKYPAFFHKYGERINHLKEKDRMKVF
jgi:hypothetical protein